MFLLSLMTLLSLPTSSARAQLSAKKLVSPYVTDFGPQYRNVQQAVIAFQQGNHERARQWLQAAKRKHPQLAPAEVMQARLYLSAGRVAEAEEALERAVADDRRDPEAFLLLADLAFGQRRFTFAELTFDHAAKLLKGDTRNKHRLRSLQIRLYAGRAAVADLRGLWDQSIEQARLWKDLEPENPAPYGRMARGLFHLKKYDDALKILKKQADLDHSMPRAEAVIALMYEEAGLRDSARANMELAAENGAHDLRTRLAVSDWAIAVGLNEMARQNAEAAVQLAPKSALPLVLAGRVARQAGDLETAEKVLQKAVLLSPGNFSALNHLALTLVSSQDADKKRRAFELARLNYRAYSNDNTSAGREAAITYGLLLFRQGRESEAEKIISTALRGGSIGNESAYYVASIFAAREKGDLAIQILRPVLKMDRAFPNRDEAQSLLKQLTADSSK